MDINKVILYIEFATVSVTHSYLKYINGIRTKI